VYERGERRGELGGKGGVAATFVYVGQGHVLL
jgi:hypothetical protein